jgi:putative dehydrogenase
MKRIGIIGLGDMGIGLSRNILKAGFELTGFDLREDRLQMLESAGGKRGTSVAAVGESSDTVFIMVLNGRQAINVVEGNDGLRSSMKPG